MLLELVSQSVIEPVAERQRIIEYSIQQAIPSYDPTHNPSPRKGKISSREDDALHSANFTLELFNSSRSKPVAPRRGFPASALSPRNLDKPLKTRREFSEPHPWPAYRTGSGAALESRANSCIRGIRIRSV